MKNLISTVFATGLFCACSLLPSPSLLHAMGNTGSTENSVETTGYEVALKEIALTGPITAPGAEISGLAWHGHTLILLPQYPNFPQRNGNGRLFAIDKVDIVKYLQSKDPKPLEPQEIAFIAPDFRGTIEAFQGYEGIVFDGDTAYLVIEADPTPPKAYLVKASWKEGQAMEDGQKMPPQLVLNQKPMAHICLQAHIPNMVVEAITLAPEGIIAMHEANGKTADPTPIAHMLNLESQLQKQILFPEIPYRVTDATEINDEGRFWVINYNFIGDKEVQQDPDPIGHTEERNRKRGVERLVELQYIDGKIIRTDTPAINIVLQENDSRNWEGLASLGSAGFLVATDKFPRTILGYIKAPWTMTHKSAGSAKQVEE